MTQAPHTAVSRRLVGSVALVFAFLTVASGCAADDEQPLVNAHKRPIAMVPCLEIGPVAQAASGYGFTPTRLGALLAMLAKENFTTVVPSTLYPSTELDPDDPSGLPAKPVLLYFSAATDDWHTFALPMLAKREMMATLTVQTGILGQPGAMTAEQLADAAGQGITIATSGDSYTDLTALTDEQLVAETKGARATLKAMDLEADVFVHPRGAWDKRVVEAVKAAGFAAARGTGALTLAGGGYSSPARSRRFAMGCAAPVTATTMEQIDAYLNNDKLEVEDLFAVEVDAGKLDKIARGNSQRDSYGHIYMADKGDLVAIDLFFPFAGTFDIRTRVKSGVDGAPHSTTNDYAYSVDHDALEYQAAKDSVIENKHIVWGDHVITDLQVSEPGWHTLRIECLKDWSCLVDWIKVSPK